MHLLFLSERYLNLRSTLFSLGFLEENLLVFDDLKDCIFVGIRWKALYLSQCSLSNDLFILLPAKHPLMMQ